MSDTFNHCLDAYESLGQQIADGEFTGFGRQSTAGAAYDPLFYHSKITFSVIKKETERAYLLNTKDTDLWVPKKICRKLDINNKTVYVHTTTFLEILRSSVND